MIKSSALCAGDRVEVRSKEDIFATLDERGQLEGLPFMPEMLAFCGRQFTVTKRAHKTCDPPNGLGGRRMLNAVHLDNVRCDGEAHGGCQARCLMFWKEAWSIKLDAAGTATSAARRATASTTSGCTEPDVWAATRDSARETNGPEPVFVCQSTQVPFATQPLHSWDLSQYVEDCTSGNARPTEVLGSFVAFVAQQVATAGIGLGTPIQFAYDTVQRLRRATPYPWRTGQVQPGEKTPSGSLNLQPGELVRVKDYQEILSTINEDGNNRGMSFDAEMVPYCGGTYRVLSRVDHIIHEKSGVMQHLKNPCIVLDEVVCLACYAEHRRLCPRGIYPYWREIWLERVQPQDDATITAGPATAPRNERGHHVAWFSAAPKS